MEPGAKYFMAGVARPACFLGTVVFMVTEQRRSVGSGVMDRLVRGGCFLLMSTVAMGAIGLAVLAEPLAQRFADRQRIEAHRGNIENLTMLKEQQQELLANADHSVIVERAAINHLNYRPAEVGLGDRVELSGSWPGLERALAGVYSEDEAGVIPAGYQRWVQSLAEKPAHQDLLLILGCALVVVSLTFFNRRGGVFRQD